jgi:hypothetical protein
MASPEQQTASDIVSAQKGNESNKLQYEANLLHAMADPNSIKQINQELQKQETADPSLPKMQVGEDGSINIPGQAAIKPQEASSDNHSALNTYTQVKDGDTTITLNSQGEAVAYSGIAPGGSKYSVGLDADGHWRKTPVLNGLTVPSAAEDLGTSAPVFDKSTGELKRGDTCKADSSDILLLRQQSDGPVWARDFLLIQNAINNFGMGKSPRIAGSESGTTTSAG